MTLLELLVKELPSRGGWPEGVNCISTHADGMVFHDGSIQSYRFDDFCSDGWKPGKEHGYTNAVSKNQYEAAIKPSEWNGEGLPPVGAECEWCDTSRKDGWTKVKIMYLSHWLIVMRSIENNFGHGVEISRDLVMGEKPQFRPIRTEAECKREDATESMLKVCTNYNKTDVIHAVSEIYEAITAHKIPGVTTVPNVGQIMRATESCSREDAQKIVDLLNGA